MKQTRKKHSPVFKAKVALGRAPGGAHHLQSWPAGLKSTRARSYRLEEGLDSGGAGSPL